MLFVNYVLVQVAMAGRPRRFCCTRLGHRLGLLLVRPQHHDHVAAVLLGCELNEAVLGNVFCESLQQPESQFRTRLLSPTEHDRDLHLVALLQEPDDVALFRLVVVRVDLRSEFHLLDDRVGLVPTGFASLQCGLVLELAVVHELADRRTGRGGYLDQVEICFLGQSQCVADGDDADLLSVRTDETNFWYADPIVDTGLGADGAS